MEIITIYAGHVPFYIAHTTLEKIPYFSGRIRLAAGDSLDEDNTLYTDFDPEIFQHILTYVKYDKFPRLDTSRFDQVVVLADYLGVTPPALTLKEPTIEITLRCAAANSFLLAGDMDYVKYRLAAAPTCPDFYFNTIENMIDATVVNKYYPYSPTEFRVDSCSSIYALLSVMASLLEDLDLKLVELEVYVSRPFMNCEAYFRVIASARGAEGMNLKAELEEKSIVIVSSQASAAISVTDMTSRVYTKRYIIFSN